MTTPLTAQQVFNGEGFDAQHMLRKAERELARIRTATDLDIVYDHMFNFAVTLAAVSDWTFHLELSQIPIWAGKNEAHFTNWLRHTNSDVFVFIDLSNEFKHAHRNKPSSLAQKMMLKAVFSSDPQAAGFVFDSQKMIKMTTSNGYLIAIPWIERSAKGNDYFIDIGELAIAWWKAFIPANAIPMDKNGKRA